jgi:hypothetical protein
MMRKIDLDDKGGMPWWQQMVCSSSWLGQAWRQQSVSMHASLFHILAFSSDFTLSCTNVRVHTLHYPDGAFLRYTFSHRRQRRLPSRPQSSLSCRPQVRKLGWILRWKCPTINFACKFYQAIINNSTWLSTSRDVLWK